MRYLRNAVFAFLICSYGSSLGAPLVLADELKSYQVKAAFVFNFLKFTEIPNSDKDFTVCTLANTLAGKAFTSLEQKSFKGSPLRVRNLKAGEEISSCGVVFVSEDYESQTETVLKSASGSSILTIGENTEFCEAGGLICFFQEEGKLRFLVNLNQAKEKNITFSSKLLKLARILK